jgi:hypothetical protein
MLNHDQPLKVRGLHPEGLSFPVLLVMFFGTLPSSLLKRLKCNERQQYSSKMS